MWEIVRASPPTGEETALDGAKQAAPFMVHVDAAAAWLGEEAAF